MNFDETSNANYFDKIVKNMIRLFIPYKRIQIFDEFVDALEGKQEFSVETIQSIVVRLRDLFSEDIKTIDREKYKNWIEQNEAKWRDQVDTYQEDKLYYGLAQASA
jgi:hypothetical protein